MEMIDVGRNSGSTWLVIVRNSEEDRLTAL